MTPRTQHYRRVKIGLPPYRIDLGCKRKRREGFYGLDRLDFGQDIVWDVRDGLPFPDDSVISVHMGDFLEHICDDDQPKLWLEIYRVCSHEAVITTKTPREGTPEAWDVWHTSRWSRHRFEGLTLCWNNGMRITKSSTSGAHLLVDLVVLKSRDRKC